MYAIVPFFGYFQIASLLSSDFPDFLCAMFLQDGFLNCLNALVTETLSLQIDQDLFCTASESLPSAL